MKLAGRFSLGVGLLAVASGLLWPEFANAKQFYAFRGPHGETLLTDSPRTRPGYVLRYKGDLYNFDKGHLLKSSSSKTSVKHDFYDALIQQAGAAHGVDAALIKAVMHVESGFNQTAESSKGALGLMQLMPKTAAQYNVKDLYSPSQNINAGAEHLAYLVQLYNGDLKRVLAAYNAGEGNVERYGGIPPFPETQNYVVKVLERHKKYLQQQQW